MARRINQEVLHRRAPVAMPSGLAADGEPYGGSGSSHVPGSGGKHVMRAARDLAGGRERGPELTNSRPEITWLRTHTA